MFFYGNGKLLLIIRSCYRSHILYVTSSMTTKFSIMKELSHISCSFIDFREGPYVEIAFAIR